MPTLNIGILAHVDAGKTSLTERLLFDTGVIDRLGSVDAGDTQTDTNELERSRGITIRSAVAPFKVGDLQVNLIDTPGHPDFIAEVERALAVLDGAVLVLSAVEGVQAQTRVLMRSLRSMGLPTLIFLNKIDRAGARGADLLDDVRQKLACRIVAMNTAHRRGTRGAHTTPHSLDDRGFRAQASEILAEHDDGLLASLVAESVPTGEAVRRAIRAQTAAGLLNPVFFGSALSGAGVETLLDGIAQFLPRAHKNEDGLRGTVFAIERGPVGEKIAYVRLYAGELRKRQRITFHRRDPDGGVGDHSGRVTAFQVVGEPEAQALTAGNIARIGGLPGIRVGDQIGTAQGLAERHHFPPPRLETLVRPREASQAARLHAALVSLADQDPLIQTRTISGGDISVLLYGEVQKEVVAATLVRDFGVEADFEPSRPVYVERLVGVGEAAEEMGERTDGFAATVGLRVEPARPGSGLVYRLEVELGSLPLAFHRAIEETVRQTLQQGLYGWAVPNCTVSLTRSGYSSAGSTAADFRNLTPLVLMRALREAGTRVCEPLDAFELEIPPDAISAVTAQLGALGSDIRESTGTGTSWLLVGRIPARRVHEFRQLLPGLSHGEGVLSSWPAGDQPVGDAVPVRERTDGNPLDRVEYLRHLASRRMSR